MECASKVKCDQMDFLTWTGTVHTRFGLLLYVVLKSFRINWLCFSDAACHSKMVQIKIDIFKT